MEHVKEMDGDRKNLMSFHHDRKGHVHISLIRFIESYFSTLDVLNISSMMYRQERSGLVTETLLVTWELNKRTSTASLLLPPKSPSHSGIDKI